jgi:hypothetical protein
MKRGGALFNIVIMRATQESTRELCVPCGMCRGEFELGPVYAWITTDGSPDELCEGCLEHLCEWARSEGFNVPWKDAHAVYVDARGRYHEPMATEEELRAMSAEEQDRIYQEAYLTPWER